MDEVEELIHLLKNSDTLESRYAARRLGKLNDTRALAAMRYALLSPDHDNEVQRTIAWALANMAKTIPATAEAIVPDLLRSIAKDEQYHKNPIALGPLLEIGVQAVPALIKCAHEKNSYHLGLKAISLALRIDPDNPEIASGIPRILLEMLGAGDRRVWEHAADRLGVLKLNDQQFEAILSMLDDPDCENHGQGAMMALEALKDARAVPALTRKLRHEIADPEINFEEAGRNRDARADAANALASIGEAKPEHRAAIVAALKDALDCKDAHVRRCTVYALERVGVPAVPALVLAMINDDSVVRQRASEALGKIAKVNAEAVDVIVPVLIGALKDNYSDVRKSAVMELGEIAKANPTTVGVVVPALIGELNDRDSNMRWKATQALGEILKGCDKTESLDMFEKGIKEGAEALRKADRTKDDVHEAMMKVADLIGKAAAKKNELARMEMEKDGLMLAGEKPRPPRHGGMYRGMQRKVLASG